MPTWTSKASRSDRESLTTALRARAAELGFDAAGIAAADGAFPAGMRLKSFLDDGRQGDMDWLAARADWRAHPQALWPEAKSIVMLAMNYAPESDPLSLLDEPLRAAISVYAQRRDYHDVLKGRLKHLAQWLTSRAGGDVKVFVDTAPVMEKPLAERAGVGWQGKHTNLVSRRHGSWLYLGALFTTVELPPDGEHAERCGSCRRCLDICPTDAFPAPYQLDARRCISYLTIEHKGHIAPEFRRPMGNRVFGCDDCLAVCPWNKFAGRAADQALLPRAALDGPAIGELLALDDTGFRALTAGTPVRRLGHVRFLRNVLIAAGNSGSRDLIPLVESRLHHDSPLVRAMAVWALAALRDADSFDGLRSRFRPDEPDAVVRAEWDRLQSGSVHSSPSC